MNKYVRKLVGAILLVASSASVFAYVMGPTNFGYGGYPDHSCTQPYKPSKPYSFDSQWEVDNWNNEVEQYNREWGYYIDCISEYVEAAENDIRRVRESANEAIDEANSG